MTGVRVGAVVALALVAGLWLRLARLDARPMHHDEANQAVKFGTLLESGQYRYDAHDHHGPTLYYLSLPAAWLRGQYTLASLDERTLRGVTVVFGAATLLLLPWLTPRIGATAVCASALLMAVSPVMVFYSRMFIQESLFACFTLAFVIAAGCAAAGRGLGGFVLAGVAAGLAVATKETAAIVLPAVLGAVAIAWWSLGAARWPLPIADSRGRVAALAGLAMAAFIAALFYSSFFTNPSGVLEPFLGARTYVDRGIEPVSHGHPWHYYLRMLTYVSSGGLRWSEGLVVLLAGAGALIAWLRPDPAGPERTFWGRYLSAYVAIAATAFSLIPYKTPWNVLPFYAAAIVVAGVGFSRLIQAVRSRPLVAALTAIFVAASIQLGWQARRAAVTYAADPRNPYVYAQTVPDAVRMAARIRELAVLHADGLRMQVSVVASPYEQWPLPWYLRTMPDVGYWTAPGDPLVLQAPVIVSSVDNMPALDRALSDRYVADIFGLRPEVFLTLYVERDLWERFLARATGPAPSAP
jgi:uncharacterized protein (TIGR03663 family)